MLNEIRFHQPVMRLQKLLPNGYLKMAAERLAARWIVLSQPFISNVKNGRKENPDVLNVLIEIANEEQSRLKAIEDRIAEIESITA